MPFAPPPAIDEASAARLASRHFGLTGQASLLPSERDRNFRIDAIDGDCWVLKIANAAESDDWIAAENALLERLCDSGLVPRLRRALDGSKAVKLDGHWLRVIECLPGRALGRQRWQPAALLETIGAGLGQVSERLREFDHAALHRALDWDLARGAAVIDRELPGLPDSPLRRQIIAVRERWQRQVAPRLAQLPCQALHNDANDYNLIVDGERLVGLIDFGDAVHSQRVNELAIAMAYAGLGKPDPTSAALQLARGFLRERPLLTLELEVLWTLMLLRLAVSACMAARQSTQRPDDAYLLVSQAPLRDALPRLLAVPERLAHYRVREAAGQAPLPQAAAILDWLARQSPAPLLGAALPLARAAVIDLSVAGDLASGDPSANRAGPLTARIRAQLAASAAPIGYGGWGEARALYTEAAFQPGRLGEEARSIHLGVDISAPVGSPLYAPHAGIVHAVEAAPSEQDYGHLLVLRHQTDEGEAFYSLYGHLDHEVLGRWQLGQSVAAGQCIGHIGSVADNGGWWPHVHVQLILDLLDGPANFDGACRPSEQATWLALCPDPAALLGARPAQSRPRSSAELLQQRRRLIGPSVRLSHRSAPLQIVRGAGQYLYDEQGRRHVDAYNNVPHVGHCHPRVVEAVSRQLARLNTNTRYLQRELGDYVEALLAHFPPELDTCLLVASGSEANELALRLARSVTGARDLLVLEAAYHGHSSTLIDISPYKHDGPGGAGRPDWVHACALPDVYRGSHRGPDAGARYAAEVADHIAQLTAQGHRLCGYIAESCPSVGGQLLLPPGYLAAVYAAVRQAGGICIADEVQTGLGRLGTHFWGFEAQGVVPDIVVLGKPIGNGYPLAAVICRRAIAEAFDNGMEFFSTFGGSSAACAAGLATLRVVQEEGLQAHALAMGERLLAGLRQLQARQALIGDVRGSGLFLGVELVRDRATLEPAAAEADFVVARLRELGVLAGTDGPLHNVLKLRGPLCLQAADADHLLQTLDLALSQAAG